MGIACSACRPFASHPVDAHRRAVFRNRKRLKSDLVLPADDEPGIDGLQRKQTGNRSR
jgi:hypothetical protein